MPHWLYMPSCIPHATDTFNLLMEQITGKVASYTVYSRYNEKEYPSRRLSCVFSSRMHNIYGDSLPTFPWEDSSIISGIKEYTEHIVFTTLGVLVSFDYALVHLYRDGNDLINYHADAEGRNSHIASISLGATRKFRFRLMGQTGGFEEEYELQSGALVIMHPSCQRKYLHSVPAEKKVKEPRINITLRINHQ